MKSWDKNELHFAVKVVEKRVRSSQASISINSCIELGKTIFPWSLKLSRTEEEFSGMINSLTKLKLTIINKTQVKPCKKLNNLWLVFPKRVFLVKNRKNECHNRISSIYFRILSSKFVKKVYSALKQKKWTNRRF